jgi:hypothetical protein
LSVWRYQAFRVLQPPIRSRYLAGLWEHDFLFQLLWQLGPGAHSTRLQTSPTHLPQNRPPIQNRPACSKIGPCHPSEHCCCFLPAQHQLDVRLGVRPLTPTGGAPAADFGRDPFWDGMTMSRKRLLVEDAGIERMRWGWCGCALESFSEAADRDHVVASA